MKTIKRRAFCKAAAAAVAGVLSPHAAAEALMPQAAQAVVGSAVPEDYYSFAFRSDHSETDLSHDFYYTDAFFENTALQYSHKLALATLGLVAASGNTYQSDALYRAVRTALRMPTRSLALPMRSMRATSAA